MILENDEQPIPQIQDSILNLKITPSVVTSEGMANFQVKINFSHLSFGSEQNIFPSSFMNRASNASTTYSQITKTNRISEGLKNSSELKKTVKILYHGENSQVYSKEDINNNPNNIYESSLPQSEKTSKIFSDSSDEDSSKENEKVSAFYDLNYQHSPKAPLGATEDIAINDLKPFPNATVTTQGNLQPSTLENERFCLFTNRNCEYEYRNFSQEKKNLVFKQDFDQKNARKYLGREDSFLSEQKDKNLEDEEIIKKFEELELQSEQKKSFISSNEAYKIKRASKYICSPASDMKDMGMEPSVNNNLEFWNDNDIFESSAGIGPRSTER